MNDIPFLIAALAVGIGLGLFYFGGLWLTVRYMNAAGKKGTLFVASFLVRSAVVVSGFYLVMDGEWERIVACLAGFLITRLSMVRILGKQVRVDGRGA